VYAAVTDGYLVIFEKDFKRNFIHVRDVADCFLHCLDHGPRMAGRAYNAGLDAANLSKAELALAVKKRVPEFHVIFSEIGSDPDKRNYVVSNQRLREAGFEASRSLDSGIEELVRAYRMLPLGGFRNA
jgi:nucleoside-diphosphate-sugar epimerase